MLLWLGNFFCPGWRLEKSDFGNFADTVKTDGRFYFSLVPGCRMNSTPEITAGLATGIELILAYLFGREGRIVFLANLDNLDTRVRIGLFRTHGFDKLGNFVFEARRVGAAAMLHQLREQLRVIAGIMWTTAH